MSEMGRHGFDDNLVLQAFLFALCLLDVCSVDIPFWRLSCFTAWVRYGIHTVTIMTQDS